MLYKDESNISDNQPDGWQSFIRDNPLIFIKFIAIEYMQASYDREWAADVMQDLLNSIATQTKPKFDVNARAYMEALACIKRYRDTQPVRPPTGAQGGAGVPSQAAPRKHPDKIAMWKYAQKLGIPQQVFENWWDYGESTGWIHSDGLPVRSMHASLKGWFKNSQEQKTDSPPETAQTP
jgi:hypothetical protein